MIIIAGYVIVDETDLSAYVQVHGDLVRRARAFDGCIDLSISADPVDPRRINNVEIGVSPRRWMPGAAKPTFPITESKREADPCSGITQPTVAPCSKPQFMGLVSGRQENCSH